MLYKRKAPKTLEEIRAHFKKRMFQRFNITITDKDYKFLKNNRDKMQVVFRQSNTKTHYRFIYKGKTIIGVYNKSLKGFVTALIDNEDEL